MLIPKAYVCKLYVKFLKFSLPLSKYNKIRGIPLRDTSRISLRITSAYSFYTPISIVIRLPVFDFSILICWGMLSFSSSL